MRTSFVCLAIAACAAAHSAIATFDDLAEGAAFSSFTNGGVRLFDPFNGLSFLGQNFVVEAAAPAIGPAQSGANVISLVGYSPGDPYGFGRFSHFSFTLDALASYGAVDVFTLTDAGNTLQLEGWRAGNMVASSSFVTEAGQQYGRLEVSGTFDTFRLVSSGPNTSGDSFVVVDNVEARLVPEPGTLAALALGGAALLRRRRR